MGYYDGLINQQINPQMVNTGYQNSYQNGYNYYDNFVKPNQNQQPQLPPQEVMKVNGKNGVDMLNMSPNSSLLALDINKPLVWFIQTDGAGYKTPTPYKIVPYTEEENVDSKVMTAIYNLETRLSTLEGMVNNASNEQQSDYQYDGSGVKNEPAKSSQTKPTKSKRSTNGDV